jgi:hypothetical protein
MPSTTSFNGGCAKSGRSAGRDEAWIDMRRYRQGVLVPRRGVDSDNIFCSLFVQTENRASRAKWATLNPGSAQPPQVKAQEAARFVSLATVARPFAARADGRPAGEPAAAPSGRGQEWRRRAPYARSRGGLGRTGRPTSMATARRPSGKGSRCRRAYLEAVSLVRCRAFTPGQVASARFPATIASTLMGADPVYSTTRRRRKEVSAVQP